MELAEPIESINKRLADQYGIETESTLPIWRVVWSNDQLEKRLMDVSPTGISLIHPMVFEVPKYLTKDRFILERLVYVPEEQQKELAGVRKSYEPLWVFESVQKEYLPPRTDACQFVIDLVLAAMNRRPGEMAKYVEVDDKEERIAKLSEELFGNETQVSDALTYKEGIVVPNSYKGENNAD
jgi:hypothetical protein